MTANLLCVRCGKRPRVADAFICQTCADDPAARTETNTALALEAADVGQRRRYVVKVYGWAGGWDRRV